MLAFDAKASGMKAIILDPTPACPAGQAADDQMVAEYSDVDAIHELASRSDVLTYEFENVDLDALESVKDQVFIPQGTKLLYTTNNRMREKTFIQSAGCEVAKFRAVKNRVDLEEAVNDLGLPVVLKTCEGGYDGKGQVVLKAAADLDKTADVLACGDCILKKLSTSVWKPPSWLAATAMAKSRSSRSAKTSTRAKSCMKVSSRPGFPRTWPKRPRRLPSRSLKPLT